MKRSALFLVIIILFSACSSEEKAEFSHEERNSVYYWRTTFAPGSADFAFIHKHDIGRIYLRMFDVTLGIEPYNGNYTIPNATLRIPDHTYTILKDSFANTEFIPVVYITLEALKKSQGEETILAENIVTRVKNMCSYNEIPNVKGIQLDCDWTKSTEKSFFELCNYTRKEIESQNLKWHLSSTIRLHQLRSMAPPVDYGVLMIYNTGNYNDPDAANSIIEIKDVKPYLKNLDKYPLHLDMAYPTYSWQLLFHNRTFIGFLNGVDISDTTKFKHNENSNIYQAIEHIPYNNIVIRNGDFIRCETSDYEELMAVKTLVEQKMNKRPHSNILYHFDLRNLQKYSYYEINNLLSVSTSK